MNRMLPERLSRIRERNGWSARKTGGCNRIGRTAIARLITTAFAAVTVDSDGLVGDKFLFIHKGSDNSREAQAGTTLSSKEPIELSAMIAKASGVIDQTSGAAISDVQGKLNVALDTVTRTVNNADGLVSDARHGKGKIGVLLNDPQTASQL